MKGCESTYAKEKLSTFWMAATAFPLMVMFVNGVLCSVSFPYQSIARTDAWPPSQLQLDSPPFSNSSPSARDRATHLISASPAQIKIFILAFARAAS